MIRDDTEYTSLKDWKEVREKWYNAIETGWRISLWKPCVLCKTYDVCDDCPICPYWCDHGHFERSRLNLYSEYHYGDEISWEESIIDFLREIDEMIEDVETKANR